MTEQPPTSDPADELEYLRAECQRLRAERDVARVELRYRIDSEATESELRLRVIAESLDREIKERFFGRLRSALWAAALFLGIATAGGLWKLSDIVTARVDEKVKEKEGDIATLREQIIKAVVDFEREAGKSLDEISRLKAQVARESDQATGEIREAKARILAFAISPDGDSVAVSPAIPVGADAQAWFGSVGRATVAVAGSEADGVGYESVADDRTVRGAFSLNFQRGLLDITADVNRDEAISVAEAVAFTKRALTADKLVQTPVLAGPGSAIMLFSTRTPVSARAVKYKTVRAVVVGINEYNVDIAALRGAVNDAHAFRRLLDNRDRALFGASDVALLSDRAATKSAIMSAIERMGRSATADDLVVFYFSGHVTVLKRGSSTSKVMFPTDGDIKSGGYISVADVVARVSQMGARNALVVVDG